MRLSGILRRLRAAPWVRAVAARIGSHYIRLCSATSRWEVIGVEERARLQSGSGRHILAIWHGRLAMVPADMRVRVRVHALISRNNDGDIIARIVERFGIACIRGSTHDPRKPDQDRGGAEAFRSGIGFLRDHADVIVALTPDGPRGPRMRCHRGVALLSAMARVPVTPWTYAVARGWELSSWDRFLLPLPFTRGVIAYGPPIPPPDGPGPAAIEAHRLAIEAALTDLTRRADALVGRLTPGEAA